MIEYRACNSMITPMLARRVMADAFAAHHSAGQWAMRIEQKISENCAIDVSIETSIGLQMTLCGLPILFDERISIDTIELHDKDGGVIARITQLAVPV